MGTQGRSRLRAALFGALLIVMTVAPVRAASPTTFSVTTAADLAGSTCGATCSLRQAINAANANTPAADTIVFAVPGGPATVTPSSALPVIIDAVTIDGASQPGTKLVGTSAGASANGLDVQGSFSVVRGLEIRQFARHGVLVDGAHDTLIGGDTVAEGNVITANGGDGIAVIGDGSAVRNQLTANSIFGNGELSIDLADDNQILLSDIGDSDTGPNGYANPPELTLVPGLPATQVTIQLNATFGVGSARADVYWSPTCPVTALPSGLVPQAREHLGFVLVPMSNLGSLGGGASTGSAVFTLPTPRSNGYLTATMTAAEGTSELSLFCAMIQAPTDLGVSASTSPIGAVDVGSAATATLTATNFGPATHTDPVAGFSFLDATTIINSIASSQGSCVVIPSTVAYCDLGLLASGASATVTMGFTPTMAGPLHIDAAVFDLSQHDTNPDNDGSPIDLAVAAQESVSGGAGPGGTVTSDSEADGATPTDPIETSVTVPPGNSGSITIAERADSAPPPAGYSFFDQASVITVNVAPGATQANPLVFRFTLDSSIVPADPLVVFRNGVPVPACTVANPVTDPSATPNPCYLPPETIGDDLVITVRTSAASTWRVGTLLPPHFTGFFAPVDNGGVLNQVKAGQAIPLKFSLGGNRGLAIFATGSPASGMITCGNAPIDPVEQTVTAGGSSLSYDAASDRYQYVWKSDKAWAGTCRRLTVTFTDGEVATALFQFVK